MGRTLGSVESSQQLIRELYIDLRAKINAWACVTKQTAQARMGYIGQHLVSVVTGYPGGRSGARGKDLVLPNDEYAEIKTCYRVDQLGKCNDCGAAVSAIEAECGGCGSKDIKRNDDSKWLIAFQHEDEFAEFMDPRFYYLVLFEFTDLANPHTIRASIWRVESAAPGFAYCLIDYYLNIRSRSISKAPFDLWPYALKFELMRPLLIYQTLIGSDDAIKTVIFPGRDSPIIHRLSPLHSFVRSRNLTQVKIHDFARRLDIVLPATEKRAELLKAAQSTLDERKIPPDVATDALARALYWADIAPHITDLPPAIQAKLKQTKSI